MKSIDLNVDIAEGFPFDRELVALATSASICCGEHAGSWELTLETIAFCKKAGVRIGVHPGFPDREGFGRREPKAWEVRAWAESLDWQCMRFCEAAKPAYVKPHGAWYRLVPEGPFPLLDRVWSDVCRREGIPLMMNANLRRAAAVQGVRGHAFIFEGFPERGYAADGRLLLRSEPGALLDDLKEIGEQAKRLALYCDSLCVHGDSAGCVEKLAAVRSSLELAGYRIGP